MSAATGPKRPMRIAVASGKGGTGKTTVAVALAQSADAHVMLLDCDVEEPNAAIFLPGEDSEHDVTVPIPVVDELQCSGCQECVHVCRFNAIAMIKKTVMIFSELCHSCGGCMLACPERAITEVPESIGIIKEREVGFIKVIQGELKVGKAMSPPLIRAVKKRAQMYETDNSITIIDCPPGTSCPMITAVKNSDFVLLVTEPTPFGLHDLSLAVRTIRNMGIPFAVVINRCTIGDERVNSFCAAEHIPILAEIPDDRRIAEAYAQGISLVSVGEEYRRLMDKLLTAVIGHIKGISEL